MNVIFIGFRGSGKTTLGRRLALKTSRRFLDLDEMISKSAGLTIREIFSLNGEAGFRKLESHALLEALQLTQHVISLGGGAVLSAQNREAIKKAGHVVIYLRATPEVLHDRICQDPLTASQRPELTHLGGNVEEVRTLLAVREPIYRELRTIELDVDAFSEAELIDQLLIRLKSLQPEVKESFTTFKSND